MSEFKIDGEGYYKNRAGEKIEILKRENSVIIRWKGSNGYVYQDDGFVFSGTHSHRDDIVAKWPIIHSLFEQLNRACMMMNPGEVYIPTARAEYSTNVRFWIVWCAARGAPHKRHEERHLAEAEAERLSKKHPDLEFIVLEAVSIFKGVVKSKKKELDLGW